MPKRLIVTMFGALRMWEECISQGGIERREYQTPTTIRSQSLLAYLLLHREKRHAREALAEMFWPGKPRHRARRSLSTALWRIRRCFEPNDPLEGDHHVIGFRYPGEVWIDVEAFETGIREASGVEALHRYATMYAGTFLAGLYDDWVVRERDWLQSLYEHAWLRIMAEYEAQADYGSALKAAFHVLQLDETNEAAHRVAMRAYWQLGQRTAALEQFHRCQQALAQQLAVEPSAETISLYRTFLAQKEVSGTEKAIFEEPERGHEVTVLPPSRLFLNRQDASPLVGREQLIAFLWERWQRAVAKQGQAVFLHGEAGIGKTRLLAALAERVRQGGGQLIAVQCDEYERGQLYGTMVDILHGAMAIGRDRILQSLSIWQQAVLAKLAPELRQLLPPDAPYWASSEIEQKQVFLALAQVLIRLANQRPLLLLVDDLQWAHTSTLAWLSTLIRAIDDAPLLVVGAYRSEEVAPSDFLARMVHQLAGEGRAALRQLPRLSPAQLAEWLHGLDDATLAQIHLHTEGNPFFVLETVRTLMEQGRLTEEAGRFHLQDGRDLPLPESVRQAIAIRMDSLEPRVRQGLRVAAVIGRMFDMDVWMRVWGQPEDVVLSALDELLTKRFLKEGEGAFTRDYEFEHHLVRETIYVGIPKRQRAQWHVATAKALEALRGGESGISAEIAFHYLRADQPQWARPWLLQAGDQAVAAAATEEALRFYQRALAGYPHDMAFRFERAVLVRKIGEVYFRRGDYVQAEQHFLQALTLLQRVFPSTKRGVYQAVAGALIRWLVQSLIPIRGLIHRAMPTPALREEVATYTSLGWMYSLQSRYEEYLLVSLRALNASERARYARGIALAATALGIAADFLARFRVATHFHQRARAEIAKVDHPADIGFVAFGQAYHAYLLADEPTVLERATLASKMYRQVGDMHRWALAMVLRAYVHVYRAELEEVRRIAQELMMIGAEMQATSVSCMGEGLAGTVAFWQGTWEAGWAHYQRAARLAEQIPDYMSLTEYLAGGARCLLRMGAWSQAEAVLTQAGESVAAHDVRGDSLTYFAIARFEASLWAAVQFPAEREHWLSQAQKEMHEAQQCAKAFHPAKPEVWRLCGRYAWLTGRKTDARHYWAKSMHLAEAMGHTLDWHVSALEMGMRLEDEPLLARARERLLAWHATGEMRFLSRFG